MVAILSTKERNDIKVQRRIVKLKEMQLKVSEKRLKLNLEQKRIIEELESYA